MAKQISDEEVAAATGMSLVEQPKEEKKTEEEGKKEDSDDEEDEKEEKKEEGAEEKKETEDEKKSEESEKKEATADDKSKEKKEEKAEDKKEDEKKTEEPSAKFDELISSELKEYEIENVAELKEILDGVDVMAKTIEKLSKKTAEPEFKSDSQKKAFEFITTMGYDPARFGEGLQAHAKLVSMDLTTTDPLQLIEEQYVLEHPELTREEALRRFGKKERSKYVVSKDDYDGDADKFKEAEEDAKIELKSRSAKAKDFLKKKQEEYKAPVKEEKKDEEVKVTPVIQTAIKDTVAEFKSYGEGLESLTFEDEKNPDNKFTFKLTKEDRKRILEAGTRYLSRPDIYNEKGEIPEHDVEKYFENYAFAIRGREIVEASLKHALRVAERIKIDEVAKKKPDYKGGKESGAIENLDPMEQAEIHSKKVVEERRRGVRR